MTGNQAKSANRAQAQCDRILNAAEQCFIRYGFHAASMAKISEAAEMSPGLIYRYFDSKAAIIKAIVERQLEIMRIDIAALLEGADFVALVAEMFASWRQGNYRGMSPLLYLELTAEATRDPEITRAADMNDSVCDKGFRDWLRQMGRARGHEPGDEELEQSVLALRCFIDGLALRAVREPELDAKQVAAMLRQYLPKFFAP